MTSSSRQGSFPIFSENPVSFQGLFCSSGLCYCTGELNNYPFAFFFFFWPIQYPVYLIVLSSLNIINSISFSNEVVYYKYLRIFLHEIYLMHFIFLDTKLHMVNFQV